MDHFRGILYGRADEWATENPILPEGTLGMEIDTGRIRRGDGVTPWTALPVFAAPDDLSPLDSETQRALGRILETPLFVLTLRDALRDSIKAYVDARLLEAKTYVDQQDKKLKDYIDARLP